MKIALDSRKLLGFRLAKGLTQSPLIGAKLGGKGGGELPPTDFPPVPD